MSESSRIQVTDEWLYKYMPVVDKAMVRSLETAAGKACPISKGCERKMRKLMRREKYGLLMQIRGSLKSVIAIFVGLIGVFSFVTLGVEADRLVFFKTIVTDFGDHVVKQFEAYGDEEFVINEPGYIPEGYELCELLSDNSVAMYLYKNVDGATLSMDQFRAGEEAIYTIDTEYQYVEKVHTAVGEIEVKMYESGFKYVYHEYKNSIYTLSAENLSIEEIVKICEDWVK